jgi:uncharacterized membrane protein (UPF0127 family)
MVLRLSNTRWMRALGRSVLSLSLVLAPTALHAYEAPQLLPIEAEWRLPNGQRIQLEVADEPQEQAVGLQLRGPLPPLRGMWFPFEEQLLRFWMHRTPEPLDMVFINDNRVIAIEANTVPCPRLPCRSYGPDGPGDGVVELAAGEAARLGITVGSPVQISPITPPGQSPLSRPATPARD